MRFSWFNHFYDNDVQKYKTDSWDDFVSKMEMLSKVEGYKPSVGEYDKQQALISSAIYGTELKRANKNVIGWESLILDIDDGLDVLERIQNHFKLFSYIIYSTANCTIEHLKIRVVIPLDKFAPVDKVHAIWYAANEWCSGVVDTQTKDKARLHYIPAMYTNKGDKYNHIFISNKGLNLNWEGLCKKWPAPAESEKFKVVNPLRDLKRAVFQQNKAMPIFDISHRDCPFVYQKMIEDYRLTPVGNHHTAIYRFGVLCCYQAEKISYPLSVEELADLMKQVDDIDGGFYPETKMLNNARDALNFTCL